MLSLSRYFDQIDALSQLLLFSEGKILETLLSTPSYYLVAGSIGLFGLIVGVILGDLLDAFELPFDSVDGWISSHAIFTGLTVFGGMGILFHHDNTGISTFLIALPCSIAAFAAIALTVRWLHKQQGNSLISRSSYHATLAKVTTPIPADGKLGEVETRSAEGGIVRHPAYTTANHSLAVNTRVIIKRVEAGRVLVIPLDIPEEENYNA